MKKNYNKSFHIFYNKISDSFILSSFYNGQLSISVSICHVELNQNVHTSPTNQVLSLPINSNITVTVQEDSDGKLTLSNVSNEQAEIAEDTATNFTDLQ